MTLESSAAGIRHDAHWKGRGFSLLQFKFKKDPRFRQGCDCLQLASPLYNFQTQHGDIHKHTPSCALLFHPLNIPRSTSTYPSLSSSCFTSILVSPSPSCPSLRSYFTTEKVTYPPACHLLYGLLQSARFTSLDSLHFSWAISHFFGLSLIKPSL